MSVCKLHAEAISFGYGSEKSIIRDISLTLHSGEMAAILGRNGCGKTTLLRLLAGLLTPDQGRVFLTQDKEEMVFPRGRDGIVFQNPDHQMISATVEEELAFGMELRGSDPGFMRARIEQTLEQFSLRSLRNHPPEALSGGQKQRVALAATMIAKPEFLLLDEPDSYLDGAARRNFAAQVDSLRNESGIIWAAPMPRRLPEADRYFVFRDGSLVECTKYELAKKVSPPIFNV